MVAMIITFTSRTMTVVFERDRRRATAVALDALMRSTFDRATASDAPSDAPSETASPAHSATASPAELAAEWSARRWLPQWVPETYPHAGWDWAALSSNVNAMSIAFIMKTRETLPWDWYRVSGRPDVTARVVACYSGAPWDAAVLIERGVAPAPANAVVADDDDDDDDDAAVVRREAYAGRANEARIRRCIDALEPSDFDLLSPFTELHGLAIERADKPWNWTTVSIYADLERFAERPDLFNAKYIAVPVASEDAARRFAAARAIARACRVWCDRRNAAARTIQAAWVHARLDPDRAMCRRFMRRAASEWGFSAALAERSPPAPQSKATFPDAVACCVRPLKRSRAVLDCLDMLGV